MSRKNHGKKDIVLKFCLLLPMADEPTVINVDKLKFRSGVAVDNASEYEDCL